MANNFNENQQRIDEDPFKDFRISDTNILHNIPGRNPCPKCGKSRKLFCYSCFVPIKLLEGKFPTVQLPLQIDIIKHKHEIDGKSTASHAAILASKNVKIFTYPDIPDYTKENVVMIFPGRNAISVSKLISSNSYEELLEFQQEPLDELPVGFNPRTLMHSIPKTRKDQLVSYKSKELPITKAIFIDSTWNQCKSIYKDEKIRKIPCVVLQNRISQFWRHQKGSPRWYLATIEAIHQFLLEIHLNVWGLNPNYLGIKNCFTTEILDDDLKQFEGLFNNNSNAYNGQYDNLLYFFKHMYEIIHSYYNHDELYAYKRRLM